MNKSESTQRFASVKIELALTGPTSVSDVHTCARGCQCWLVRSFFLFVQFLVMSFVIKTKGDFRSNIPM